MLEFFRRAFAYFKTSANVEFDKRADPKIQMEQAITDAKQKHAQISTQAAKVISNQFLLEEKMKRQETEVEAIEGSTRQALMLAATAEREGDMVKCAEYEKAASAFATQLSAAESSLEDLRSSHEDAVRASEMARLAVSDNSMRLNEQLAEQTKLLNKLDATIMQERINSVSAELDALSAPTATPTFNAVRDKIEQRAATAKGAQDLNSNSVSGRMMEVRRASLSAGANLRLEQMRESMGLAKPDEAEETAPATLQKSASAAPREASSN